MKKKVMVFGTFDGLHLGHTTFLKEAKKYGDYLIAVLPQDYIVKKLKGRLPKLTLSERMKDLKNAGFVDAVIVGDNKLSSWKILEKHRPEVVVLGFDQSLIKIELEKYFLKTNWKSAIIILDRFKDR